MVCQNSLEGAGCPLPTFSCEASSSRVCLFETCPFRATWKGKAGIRPSAICRASPWIVSSLKPCRLRARVWSGTKGSNGLCAGGKGGVLFFCAWLGSIPQVTRQVGLDWWFGFGVEPLLVEGKWETVSRNTTGNHQSKPPIGGKRNADWL